MELQEIYPSIRKLNAEVIAISVDNIEDAARMAHHAEAEFPILADTNANVAKAYGIYDLLGDGVAAPTTIVIGNQGQVMAIHVGEHIADRISTSELLQVLTDLKWSEA